MRILFHMETITFSLSFLKKHIKRCSVQAKAAVGTVSIDREIRRCAGSVSLKPRIAIKPSLSCAVINPCQLNGLAYSQLNDRFTGVAQPRWVNMCNSCAIGRVNPFWWWLVAWWCCVVIVYCIFFYGVEYFRVFFVGLISRSWSWM